MGRPRGLAQRPGEFVAAHPADLVGVVEIVHDDPVRGGRLEDVGWTNQFVARFQIDF